MPGQVLNCRAALAGLIVFAAASMVGCGSDRPKTIPISGKITFDGQPPGEHGRLHFQPTQVASGYSKRPAGGSFTAEGPYRVMSWAPDDGLVPGHYTVSLMPADPNNTKIPPKYRQGGSSGLEVEVPVDQGPIVFDIDVRTQ